MNIVYKASDPLDEFYRICDEQGEERRLEARRKIYEEKDFNCVYCLYHEKRSGCMYRECPLIPDRVCCGCATIASAWRYMAIEMNHEKLLKRINKYIYSCRWRKENMMIFINTFHQNTFMNQYNRLNHENSKLLSAVYLLSADKRLWDCAWSFVYKNGISFAKIKPKHLSADGYTLFCAARDIYLGSRHFSLSELADPAVINRSGFCLVLNAMGIRRYGYSYIKKKVGDKS